MIKARKDNLLIFGLSERNLKLLREGKPIKFNMKELGLPELDVLIYTGKDEESMKKDFFKEGLIDVNKTIIHDQNSKNN